MTDFPLEKAKAYRKRPIVIMAVELTEETQIETLEGMMTGHAGDFLIRGVKGELYPCKREIFLETYESAIAGGYIAYQYEDHDVMVKDLPHKFLPERMK